MFLKIARFEFAYALRQPVFWIISTAYFLFALVYASGAVDVPGLTTSAINVNSPWAITRMVIQLSYLALLAIAAFAGASIIRDFSTGISNILFTTKISKTDYVFGRFFGGFAACLVSFGFVFVGLMAGGLVPWADPRLLGPFPFEGLVAAFLVFALPNIFIGASILFSIALLTRDTVKTYVGAIALIIAFYISRAFAGAFYASTDGQAISSLAEPFGAYAATMTVLDWSPFERNTIAIWGQDLVDVNRLVWLTVSALILLIAFSRFRMETAGTGRTGQNRQAAVEVGRKAGAASKVVAGSPVTIAPSWPAQFGRLLTIEMRFILRAAPFLIILALSCLGLWAWVAMYGRAYGTGFYPHTGRMVSHLQTVLQVPMLAMVTFYAAELTWRSRSDRFDEILEALPVTNAGVFLARLLALWIACLVILSAGVLVAILFQLWRGYGPIEPGTYLVQLGAISMPYFVVMSTLALSLQSIIGNRFLGMLAMVVVFVVTIVAVPAGFTSNLLIPGAVIDIHHNDAAGFGHYLASVLWFRLYWLMLAALLAVFAVLFMARGTETGFMQRARRISAGLRGAGGVLAAVSLGGAILVGSYIAYNVYGLNSVTSEAREHRRAYEYERTYGELRNIPQPKIKAIEGRLDLFPETRHLELEARYTLTNGSNEPISAIILVAPKDTRLTGIDTSISGQVSSDAVHEVHRITLESPLLPGEGMDVAFSVASDPIIGFENRPGRTPVAHDGSFLLDNDFLPVLGYSPSREIEDALVREDFGLPERASIVRPFGDQRGLVEQEGQRFHDWVLIDLTISTSQDQIAVGQGDLVAERTQEGRSFYRYRSTVPVKMHMAITSASYDVHEREVLGIEQPIMLQVFALPGHSDNAQELLDTMAETLSVLESAFGPYPYNQLRLVDAPIGRPNCRIRSDTLVCDSSLGLVNDPALDDPRAPPGFLVKLPAGMISILYVHSQIMPANHPGATSIGDGLGFYLSGLVWHDTIPPEALAEVVRDVSWKYFMERAKGEDEEGTIVDQVNQTFIGAHKNSLAIYGLELYLGRDRMNAAIRSFIEDYRFSEPPFATMPDLVKAFRAKAPDDVQPIITDFFERRTFFDIAARDAEFVALGDSQYLVRFTPETRKYYGSPQGELEETEFDYPVEVAVFGKVIDKSGARQILHRQLLPAERLDKGRIEIFVDKPPMRVGLDPFYRLLDRNLLDNRADLANAAE